MTRKRNMMEKQIKAPNHKGKRIALTVFGSLFLTIFVIAGTLASYKLTNQFLTKRDYDSIRKESVINEVEDDGFMANESLTIEKPPVNVDLAPLIKENPDTAGWVYVPCLNISYPLMYSGDNYYYLHRNFQKEYAFAGSLFIDMYSAPDFSGANTVVYGHNMIDGSMFGTLWYIPYKNAAAEDPYFWVYTPEATYRYKIFSAFGTDMYSDGFKQFESGTQEFVDWAYRMKGNSYIYTDNQRFRVNDKVVTLSTCGENSFYRTLVLGVQEAIYPAVSTVQADLPDRVADDTIIEETDVNSLWMDKQILLHLAVFILIAILLWIVLAKRRDTV